MHARVAAFENLDTSVVDDLLGRVRQNIDANRMPDAQGGLMLLDRGERKSLGITFFESEQKIRAAEPEFERMGDEIPEAQRGRRTSVDIYEVAMAEGGEGARAARVSVLEGYEEHHVADVILDELLDVPPETDLWKAKVKVLKENVEHHMDEEESELFKKAKAVLDRDELNRLGDRMEEIKRSAEDAD